MTKNSFVAKVTFKDMRILCVIYLPRAKATTGVVL